MGPKWPQNNASRYVRMSGMKRFIARTIGIRRNSRTRIKKTMSCQTPQFGVISLGTNLFHGMRAPKKMKRLEFSIMSMIVGNGRECVFFENQPSCPNPTPAPKATRKSSLPRTEPMPTQSRARRR